MDIPHTDYGVVTYSYEMGSFNSMLLHSYQNMDSACVTTNITKVTVLARWTLFEDGAQNPTPMQSP